MPKGNPATIPLPKSWSTTVRSALLHVIALTQYATVSTRGWAANSLNARVRLQAENDQLRQEIAPLREEVRIKDARMLRIEAHRRPHYASTERIAILELRAARGWSQQQSADVFQISAATIASWCRRLEEEGPQALVQLREPVNHFPDFVRYAVQRLKVLCPALGKVKIAEVLCRAGLHLAPATVGRMLKEPTQPAPKPAARPSKRVVTAKVPNHVWHVDLTTVPIGSGFWVPWLPFTLPQRWPFCWWVAVVLDHYSRRVMGVAVFPEPPDSKMIRTLLGRAIRQAGTAPKYIICDKGSQFWCDDFQRWARRRNIRLRFGAIGRHGSIAVVERFIGTLKREGMRRVVQSAPHRRCSSRGGPARPSSSTCSSSPSADICQWSD